MKSIIIFAINMYVTSDGVSRYPICRNAVIRRLYNGFLSHFRIMPYELRIIN